MPEKPADTVTVPDRLVRLRHRIEPDDVAETADDDQQHRHGQDICVLLIRDQTVRSEQIEPRVAERGDRMKDCIPDPADRSELRNEREGIKQRADPLHRENAEHDPAQKTQHVVQGIEIERVAQKHAVADAERFTQHQQKRRRDGDDAEPARLDQNENDDLAEQGPVRIRVDYDETGHADRGRCRKQRGQKRSALSARRRERQR